jgi:hypothetical protein
VLLALRVPLALPLREVRAEALPPPARARGWLGVGGWLGVMLRVALPPVPVGLAVPLL